MRVVVLGAGAVGSVLGGLLSLRQHDVLLVCRKPHADAIAKDGLRIKSSTGEYVAHPQTSSSLDSSHIDDDAFILLTAKCHDTADCADAIHRANADGLPVVAMQNGVVNEGVLAERFENVYGGVCRMTCSMLQPGHVAFQQLGRVIVGKYPKGTDAVAKTLIKAFDDVGFDCCASRNIVADKWLKLAVNTQSAVHAVVDPRDHDTNEFFEFKAGILEEARDIFKAARVKAKSFDGRDPSISEMIDDLRRPRGRRTQSGMKVHNSAWQDLYLKRDAIEAPYIHGPVIALSRESNTPAPFNEASLDLVTRCHDEGRGPGALRLREVLARVNERNTH